MVTKSEIQLLNGTIFEQLAMPEAGNEPEVESGPFLTLPSGSLSRAADAVNDFTRTQMREDGFFRRILPPLQISNDELDRPVDTDRPVMIVDRSPEVMDIRAKLADSMIRDLVEEEDRRFLQTVQALGMPVSEPVGVITKGVIVEASRLIPLQFNPTPLLIPQSMLPALREWGEDPNQ